jgi:phosphopantothenoylcysteine decarboxylase/phosphopantothenate--cysteine ligase
MSRILLGVTGGIAAYKALEFVRLADAAGHRLRVVQTRSSQHFVGRASFEALSGAPVLVHEHERDPARGAFPGQEIPAHEPLSHLELVRNAELFVVAPASANTIAKLAHGLADNLLTSAALACTCPVLVAPAMNNHMYEHPATQANLRILRERGLQIAEPTSGRLASKGEAGIGRLVEPVDLLAACERLLAAAETASERPSGTTAGPSSLRGLRVLVSAGGTREPIDAVRYLGNRSSGRMGLALADAAQRRGAEVTVVAANVTLACPPGVRCRPVSTAAELQTACEEELPACDILLMAAAVADFRPRAVATGKLKKERQTEMSLKLERTPDVLSGLAERRRADQTLVGFAAEHGAEAMSEARRKLGAKRVDAIVVNDVSRSDIGFEVDQNEVWVVTPDGEQHLPRAAKAQIAEGILDALEGLRPAAGRAAPSRTEQPLEGPLAGPPAGGGRTGAPTGPTVGVDVQ